MPSEDHKFSSLLWLIITSNNFVVNIYRTSKPRIYVCYLTFFGVAKRKIRFVKVLHIA